MKAIGIVCSPRKNGNSDVLVREILKSTGIKDNEIFYPNEMDIRGCQACYSCKEQGKCAVEDDMVKIYDAIEKADIVVFGAPIYMSGVTAQFKTVLDRLFAFLGPAPEFVRFAFLGPAPEFVSRLPKGKRAVLVVSQGYEIAREYETHINQMKNAIASIGFKDVRVLVAPGLNGLGEAAGKPDMVKEARIIGESLARA